MKNILLVGDFLEGSGLTNVLINTYKYFPEDKYKISILKYGGSNEIDGELKALNWDIYSVTPITKRPVKYFIEIYRFFKANSINFDVVHFNYSAAWNFIGVELAAKYKIPRIIIHSHNTNYSKRPSFFIKGILDFLNKRGKRVFSKKGDAFLATSNDAMEWMFDDKIINYKNRYIFKNGIDVDKFDFSLKDRINIRKQNEIHDEFIIGFLGMLNDRKNPMFAIKIFEEFLKLEHNAKFLIFGDGPLEKQIEEYLKEFNFEGRIKIMGKTKNPEVWLNGMDCLIFPSLNEGLPLVLLEAQTSGLLTIVSDAVTSDVEVTSNIFFESLNNSPSVWAQLIKNKSVMSRTSKKKIIENNGFSAKGQSKFMENIINNIGD